MASLESSINRKPGIPHLRRSLRVWTALLQADLITLSRSWMVRVWLLLLLLSFLAVPVGMLTANQPVPAPASSVLALYLGGFLNVWSTVIIVLSAGSVSLEADIVADAILSRACTRTQYILAKLAVRALAIGGVYLLGSSAAAYACWRYGANDLTWGTMFTGLAIVGMALLMLVSLGVALSVLFNNTMVSVIGLLLLWYVAGYIFAFAGVEYMSPASLTRSLPQILRDSNAPQVISCSATPTRVSILFSKEVQPDRAEQIENYRVESPVGTRHVPRTAVYDPATTTVVLSGFHFPPGEAVRVMVEGVTDEAGNVISPAANTATSDPLPAKEEEGKTLPPSESLSSTAAGHPVPEKQRAAANSDAEPPPPISGSSSPPRLLRIKATRTSVSAVFSRDMDPVEIEKLDHYTVESPLGTTHLPQATTYNASTRTVLLSGLSFQAGDPVKVTVNNVTDLHGTKISPRHRSATFRERQNWKYFVGFGLPSLLSAVLGVVWFSRRDL